jgi:hypothetical protein
MENIKSSNEVIESVKELLNQIPTIQNGRNVIPYIRLEKYGNGQTALDSLKNEFEQLDLSKAIEYNDLENKILGYKSELNELEKKHTRLTEIIGETIEGKEGSLAYQIVQNLNNEIDNLIEKRNELLKELEKQKENEDTLIEKYRKKTIELEALFKKKENNLENEFKIKEENLNNNFISKSDEIKSKIESASKESNRKIKETEENASQKVKLINQFKDFLQETNDNMKLYKNVIIGLVVIALLSICFSIPSLLNIFDSYDTFIKSHQTRISNLQIINYAFGLLIIKLPWALCLSAVFTGMYSLLKGLLITYEKINQDKRNMSAIYSISGNVSQSLNEYGIELANFDNEVEETGESFPTIQINRKELNIKKENFRWNQIMKYFEGMQQIKETTEQPEDATKLKLLTGLLNKVIDKYPKTN